MSAVLAKTLACMIVAVAFLAGAYLLPRIPLDGGLALVAYGLTEMAGKYGATVLVVLLTLVVVSRGGLSRRQRIRESVALAVVLTLTNGGMAYFNEHILKPLLAMPRPALLEMLEDGRIDLEQAEHFYNIGDKLERSRYLADRLPPGTPGMHDVVRLHWIQETGHSFPSGHSLSALTIATFFLAWGLACLSGWRWRLMQLLPIWAVLAAYSRVFLRVHSPTDILVGGCEGVIVGLLGYALCRFLLYEPKRSQPQDSTAEKQPSPAA